ncbi:MAG TPA: hypothetical protein PLK80_11065 [bacterium]|nr:MAG: hypothetical protein BWY28_02163 [bacterium ADurb.Bin236]HOY64995.1 hypothetical protein [bacterium]HPI77262.1 hypothetical protein [bacterium]HPN95056.1 hypothetical protein [bacterium]
MAKTSKSYNPGIGQRLELVIDKKCSNNKKNFAKLLHMSPSQLSQLFAEDLPVPQKRISELTKLFDVNLNWYFTGEGEPFNEHASSMRVADRAAVYLVNSLAASQKQHRLLRDNASKLLPGLVREAAALNKLFSLMDSDPDLKALILNTSPELADAYDYYLHNSIPNLNPHPTKQDKNNP